MPDEAPPADAPPPPAEPPPAPGPLPPAPPDDDDDDRPRRASHRVMWSALVLALGIAVIVLAALGHANARHYYLRCAPERVVAEQGRAFPPWGTHELTGAAWHPIALPENAECRERQTENLAELGGWYLDLLIERARVALGGDGLGQPAAEGAQSPLDVIAAQLDQALLLAHDPSHRDQRAEIERLGGDVVYWRAAQRVHLAVEQLDEASRQFDDAAGRRPEHVADAAAWAALLRRVAGELHAGPTGAPAVAAPPPPAASGATEPAVTSGATAPPAAGSAAPPAAPDAGVPAGGVLM